MRAIIISGYPSSSVTAKRRRDYAETAPGLCPGLVLVRHDRGAACRDGYGHVWSRRSGSEDGCARFLLFGWAICDIIISREDVRDKIYSFYCVIVGGVWFARRGF